MSKWLRPRASGIPIPACFWRWFLAANWSTGAFTEGWVPQAGEMNFVRIDTFEPEAGGTRYTATARHWDEKAAETHKAMGFEQGWGAVADQLAALAEGDAA